MIWTFDKLIYYRYKKKEYNYNLWTRLVFHNSRSFNNKVLNKKRKEAVQIKENKEGEKHFPPLAKGPTIKKATTIDCYPLMKVFVVDCNA